MSDEDIRDLRKEMNTNFRDLRNDIKGLSYQITTNKVNITNSTKIKLLALSAFFGGASSLVVGLILIKSKIGG
jgi:hypothetical protein